MSSYKEPLITPPKEVKCDSSELQKPVNTMENTPISSRKEDQSCKCSYSTLCCVFWCGISTIFVSSSC